MRTHPAGALRAEHEGQSVTLAGWVARRRDHGGVIFIDLRDASGVSQVVFRAGDVLAQAHRLRSEFCIETPVNPKFRRFSTLTKLNHMCQHRTIPGSKLFSATLPELPVPACSFSRVIMLLEPSPSWRCRICVPPIPGIARTA